MRKAVGLAVPSFGKINWILKILGRRSDGFHEVRTVLQTIELQDRIRFETHEGPGLELQVSGRRAGADQDNLVLQAARLLREKTGVGAGARIHLEKRIPVGAGLGGGSSNAAVTLLALNQIWDCRLSREELIGLGKRLGSDVPFFLLGGTCCATGRGEILSPAAEPPEQILLLVYPNLEISTRTAYAKGAWPSLERAGELTTKEADTRIYRFREAAANGLFARELVDNDFNRPMMQEYPVLAETARLMLQAGCEQVVLCGSGSTLLGLAKTRLEATASVVRRRKPGEVYLCRSLSRTRYETRLRQAGIIL